MRDTRVTTAGTVIVALAGVVAAFITPSQQGTAPSPDQLPAPGPTVLARIENTGGIGVSAYSEPRTRESVRFRGPAEGDVVIVVCQRLDGEPMTDRDDPQPDQPAGWTLWDRLPDGRWLPDIYTDLPKTDPSVPTTGLRSC